MLWVEITKGLFSLKQFEMEFSKEITNYKLCLATGINQYTIDNVWQQVKKLRTLSKLITNCTGIYQFSQVMCLISISWVEVSKEIITL